MMLRRTLLIGFLLSGFLPPFFVQADEVVRPACGTKLLLEIANEQRFFRSVVYGLRPAADAEKNAIRSFADGTPWIKVDTNEWRTADAGTAVFTDFGMDTTAYPPPRKGLLELKKTPTSDLIPLLLQSTRAFRCRLQSICQLASASLLDSAPASIEVKVDGCETRTLPKYAMCAYTQSGEPADQTELVPNFCDSNVEQVFEREQRLLAMTISYDASYRTLVQFAGMMQKTVRTLHEPSLNILARTVRTLKEFQSLPCYSGQCDE